MEELVRVENKKEMEYEKLLVRRDSLKKEANATLAEYIHAFGDRIVRNYEKKIECIEKKKAIAFCQTLQNRGLPVKANDLSEYLLSCMEEYRKHLEDMKKDRDLCKELESVPAYIVQKVKELYRKIVKVIHPDMQPELFQRKDIQDFWERVQEAYRKNDSEEMEELLVLLKGLGVKTESLEIPDLDERIQKVKTEIDRILSTDPYCYRFLLDDPEQVGERISELDAEYTEYEAYALELNGILSGFKIEETKPWEMN